MNLTRIAARVAKIVTAGASTFYTVGYGATAKAAFQNAVSEAQHESGHGGYTGTIAEKSSFVTIVCPKEKTPQKYAEELIAQADKRVDDKYGPAGCIALGGTQFLFFGWASD